MFALDAAQACWVVSKRMPEPRVAHSDSFTSVQAEMKDADLGSAAIEEVLDIVEGCPAEVTDIIRGTDPTTVTTHCTYIRGEPAFTLTLIFCSCHFASAGLPSALAHRC